MPLALGDSKVFQDIYEGTRRSVVGLIIDDEQVGAGLIVHKSPELTVIAVPSSCVQECVKVSFFDGTTAVSNEVTAFDDGGFALLFVDIRTGAWIEAKLGHLGEDESETVLTIVPFVSHTMHRQRTFISHIISPRCTSVDIAGRIIHRTNQLFSYTLPTGNSKVADNHKKAWMPIDNYVLGAPVFNMEGEWVGFPTERSTSSLGMKLGIRGEIFQGNLNTWLAGRQWEVAIQPLVDRNNDLLSVFDWY